MSKILTDSSQTALWHSLVTESEQRASVTLEVDVESYLVFALMRHLRDSELAQHVLALDYLHSLDLPLAQREQQLRDVGDRCLILAGLYPEQAEQRLVSLRYFLELGQHAYSELAAALRAALGELYRHLALSFTRVVRVLIELRKLSGEWAGLNALARYELCTSNAADAARATSDFPNAILLTDSSRRAQ